MDERRIILSIQMSSPEEESGRLHASQRDLACFSRLPYRRLRGFLSSMDDSEVLGPLEPEVEAVAQPRNSPEPERPNQELPFLVTMDIHHSDKVEISYKKHETTKSERRSVPERFLAPAKTDVKDRTAPSASEVTQSLKEAASEDSQSLKEAASPSKDDKESRSARYKEFRNLLQKEQEEIASKLRKSGVSAKPRSYHSVKFDTIKSKIEQRIKEAESNSGNKITTAKMKETSLKQASGSGRTISKLENASLGKGSPMKLWPGKNDKRDKKVAAKELPKAKLPISSTLTQLLKQAKLLPAPYTKKEHISKEATRAEDGGEEPIGSKVLPGMSPVSSDHDLKIAKSNATIEDQYKADVPPQEEPKKSEAISKTSTEFLPQAFSIKEDPSLPEQDEPETEEVAKQDLQEIGRDRDHGVSISDLKESVMDDEVKSVLASTENLIVKATGGNKYLEEADLNGLEKKYEAEEDHSHDDGQRLESDAKEVEKLLEIDEGGGQQIEDQRHDVRDDDETHADSVHVIGHVKDDEKRYEEASDDGERYKKNENELAETIYVEDEHGEEDSPKDKQVIDSGGGELFTTEQHYSIALPLSPPGEKDEESNLVMTEYHRVEKKIELSPPTPKMKSVDENTHGERTSVHNKHEEQAKANRMEGTLIIPVKPPGGTKKEDSSPTETEEPKVKEVGSCASRRKIERSQNRIAEQKKFKVEKEIPLQFHPKPETKERIVAGSKKKFRVEKVDLLDESPEVEGDTVKMEDVMDGSN